MKIKKRILMTTDTANGIWTYTLELVRSLEQHKVHVSLATFGTALTREQKSELARIKNITVYESNFKSEWMENPWTDISKAGKWLLNLSQMVQPDLIHLNNYAFAGLNWDKPVLTVAHSCLLTWKQALNQKKLTPDLEKYKKVVIQSLHESDLVIFPSKSHKEDMEKIYGKVQGAKVVYNGRNPNGFKVAKKKPFIFCVGRIWDEAKNMSVLSEIAPRLPWPICVAGSNINPDTGEKTEIPNVHFLGAINQVEIAEYLSKASIYLMPSFYEPFGLSIVEAAMSECALLLNDIPSLKEIWNDSAMYVNAGDPDKLYQMLNLMIQNHFYRQILSNKARVKSRVYNAGDMASEYLSVYKKMIRQHALQNQEMNYKVA